MDEIQREKAQRSLKEFMRQGWPIIEPARPFSDNWHLDAICEHLEAVTRGDIRRLLILVPPGTTKSTTVSVCWPAWGWGPCQKPWLRWMFASYAQHLSTKHSIHCRRILRSDWYQRNWGSSFKLLEDRDTLTVFQNDHMGYRLATSTGGVATGERGDVIGCDDPHSVMEASSEKERQAVIDWWDETMSTRVNDLRTSAFVIIMQRVHRFDLAQHVLDQGGYTTLLLPMEYEPDRCCFTDLKPKKPLEITGPPYRWDPRREEGELLWEERFPRESVDDLKVRLGSYGAASQLQMRPAPREGGLVKLHWFGRYKVPPARERVKRLVHSWDTANKAGQHNAYSVCSTWAEVDTGYYLLHVFRERMNTPDLNRAVRSHASFWAPDAVLIEDAASGIGLIQTLVEESSLPVIPVRPDKDKITRMDTETPMIEAGRVYLPETADWLAEFESEVRDFPNSSYMDQVDSMSQYLHWSKERSHFWVV